MGCVRVEVKMSVVCIGKPRCVPNANIPGFIFFNIETFLETSHNLFLVVSRGIITII